MAATPLTAVAALYCCFRRARSWPCRSTRFAATAPPASARVMAAASACRVSLRFTCDTPEKVDKGPAEGPVHYGFTGDILATDPEPGRRAYAAGSSGGRRPRIKCNPGCPDISRTLNSRSRLAQLRLKM